jgi:hypothetical protein
MKNYKGNFELFDLQVRRTQSSSIQRVILECPETVEEEKKLIDFRKKNVEVQLFPITDDGYGDGVEEAFYVSNVQCRTLKNGDKLRIILECQYEKDFEKNLVDLRYHEVELNMKELKKEDIMQEADE